MNKIIIIRGPLGVGKTTVSKLLAERLNFKYLSLDKIIKDNNLEDGEEIPLEHFLISNEIIFKLINNSEITYIIDGCFYYQEQINDLIKKFKNNIQIFSLISNIKICIARDSKREKTHGENSARFVHRATTKIKVGEEIDNSNLTIEETVTQIIKKLQTKNI